MILSTNLRNVRVSVLGMFVLCKFECVSNPILSSYVQCHFFLSLFPNVQVVSFFEILRIMNTLQMVYILTGNR